MDKTVPQFSIVVPLLNEKESIRPLYDEIRAAMDAQKASFEVLFIDDGSTDGSISISQQLSKEDERVRFFSLGYHQGKSAALALGFKHAQGEYIATLDGDLQDQPKEIIKLCKAMNERNADLVSGWKKIRHDAWHKLASSHLFNGLVRSITGIPLHDFNCGIKLYKKSVTREIPLYGELHRFTPALAAWKGFHVTEEIVEHRARKYGKSKFGLSRAFGMVVDILTLVFLMRYEGKPSHLFSGLGLLFATAGSAINLHLLIKKVTGGTIAPQYPLMILGVTLLVLGIQFIFFGLLSEMMVYLSRQKRN